MNQFKGYNIFIKNLRDGGTRIEIDISEDQWDNVKDLKKLAKGMYKITLEEDIEE